MFNHFTLDIIGSVCGIS